MDCEKIVFWEKNDSVTSVSIYFDNRLEIIHLCLRLFLLLFKRKILDFSFIRVNSKEAYVDEE